ncbi:uncharacterized protein LOC120634328 isoform X1 [Pararge aegeria]|uniref:uncharacterized protein LOC120634328 isoform X1 n=1 Tax=Pararge aegeria TaxID=116150 RepID=UPI0019CFDE66|nr:uncharacterized protein LOC120634328 isoform X1 [Pararge aegeria]
MEKYYKNFILCGEIDFYCVLCKETYGDEADVERHMRWDKHRNVLKLQEYLHKYKKDFIYKLNDIFYCEVCNLLTVDVASHVKEDYHKAKKATSERISKKSEFVKREPNGTIKVNSKVVSKLQWHGFKDGKCSTCNLDKIYKLDHITSTSHMSYLTQSRVKFEGDKCYRELKSDKFYCFTCFETFENEHLNNHWTDNHSKVTKPRNSESNNGKTTTNKSKCDSNNNKCNLSIKLLAECFSSKYEFDVEKKTANCLLCGATVTPSLKNLTEHPIEFHPETENLRIHDHGKRRHELAIYANENYLKLNEGGSKIFCTLCDIFTSAHMNCATQHVEGLLHRGHLEIKGLIKDSKHLKPPTKGVAYKSFLKDMYGPFKILEYNVVIINDGICIELMSFWLIQIINGFKGSMVKCYACNLTMNLIELPKHSKEINHMKIVENCKVLLIDDDGHEIFIREIHPGLYHCGCCNKVFPFWDNVTKHLKSFPHKTQIYRKERLSMVLAPSESAARDWCPDSPPTRSGAALPQCGMAGCLIYCVIFFTLCCFLFCFCTNLLCEE